MRRIDNKISFLELVKMISNHNFTILEVHTPQPSVQVITIGRNDCYWKLIRREWYSYTGKHFVRFSLELTHLPEEMGWKGSTKIYTRRDGKPKSFPYASAMPTTTLRFLLDYLEKSTR